ncbi:hypothetical protein BP00DRAFT_218323 [Aspergillus indologenus CBS 114.80]|uniref:Uncharacterized protein n=1 Tax=Aspergillus indologenus CBS 114.80 TaxID=1450541 RepID=A0A2V5INR2_9EURO|nr:hypothetical protein BP00DRAFT_218323 [Aspergillus indologenus CBS 114.80]
MTRVHVLILWVDAFRVRAKVRRRWRRRRRVSGGMVDITRLRVAIPWVTHIRKVIHAVRTGAHRSKGWRRIVCVVVELVVLLVMRSVAGTGHLARSRRTRMEVSLLLVIRVALEEFLHGAVDFGPSTGAHVLVQLGQVPGVAPRAARATTAKWPRFGN